MKALRRFVKGRAFRGATALAASSALAQLLALLITPILSRLYGPEAFGYLTLVVSVTGAITPAIALRLESAILLPRRKEIASALLFAGVIATITVSLVAVVTLEALFAFGQLSAMAQLSGFSWWVGGISLLSGLFVLFGQYALREMRFLPVALRNITQSMATAVAQLILGVWAPTAIGLVGGHSIGRLAGIAPLAMTLRSDLARFRRRELLSALREYRSFPLLFAPAALFNAAALALPIICAGLWFDVSSAGQWGMAERVLALPLVIVAASIGQIVESQLAHRYRNDHGGCTDYYLKASATLLAMGVFVGCVVLLAAPSVIPFILGPGWNDAAIIMQLLIPMLVTRLVASPMSKAIVIARRAKTNLVLDLGRLVLVVTVLAACRHFGASLHEFVAWTSGAFVIVYIATWLAGCSAARALDSRRVQ